jgi:hypothetical protein
MSGQEATTGTAAAVLLPMTDADALRDHLHALNEEGIVPRAVGHDAHAQPFLITLVGPYAEGEDVLFDSPWQNDIDWNQPPRCDECQGQAHGMDDLRFPVVVLCDPAFLPGGSS